MIRALIVDDEPPARVRLRQMLEALPDVAVIGEAGSGADAQALIGRLRPDVVFLDIEMPEMRGTTLAASLPDPRPFVVFATAYEHYAVEAFACAATDYLLKPINRSKLAATLARVRARMDEGAIARDVAAASALQAQMWPGALPPVQGFDCAAASIPAHGVGGDFYHAFALDAGRWGLLVGDVSGKGVPAGLVATAVQGRIETAARHARLGPAELMRTLNRDVFESTGGRRYATVVYFELDQATGEMTLVNAGHPAPLLISPDRALPSTVPSTGSALGLMEEAAFDQRTVRLDAGGLLVVYTDGVVEALDEQEVEFGESGLTEVIGSRRDQRAADLCAAILDAVRSHRGHRQRQDDVTVMVVKH